MNIRDIVRAWLLDNRYDGLVSQDEDCSCLLCNILDCDHSCFPNCVAGHLERQTFGQGVMVLGKKKDIENG